MYCLIDGIVAASKLRTPETGKPYRNIMVLQQVNGDAQLVAVKDMELHEYGDGEPFSKFCRVTNWSFDNKSGISCYIIHRETESKSKNKDVV